MSMRLSDRLNLCVRFVQACLVIRAVDRALERGGFKEAQSLFLKPWLPNSRPIPPNDFTVRQIGWAVEEACRWQLQTRDCLHRAIVSYALLQKRGARPRFVMATRSCPFASHAWTELEGVAIADFQMNAQRPAFQPIMTLPESITDAAYPDAAVLETAA